MRLRSQGPADESGQGGQSEDRHQGQADEGNSGDDKGKAPGERDRRPVEGQDNRAVQLKSRVDEIGDIVPALKITSSQISKLSTSNAGSRR